MRAFYLPEDFKALGQEITYYSIPVNTGHWQALKDVPQTKSREIENVSIEYEIPDSREVIADQVTPNLPWAEDHFQERVGGEPLNPGVQYKNWPWYRGNVEAHQSGLLQFSHTYMERFWPKNAGPDVVPGRHSRKPLVGIRYNYGDLNDVVALLAREPYTRQAVLPIFFPEDTGAHEQQRIPCTLYYHFMLRDGMLNINYTIRSCDFLRHFRDDVYMASRLCQWVLDKLYMMAMEDYPNVNRVWNPVTNLRCGTLTMLMHSLHVFEGDMPKMKREYG